MAYVIILLYCISSLFAFHLQKNERNPYEWSLLAAGVCCSSICRKGSAGEFNLILDLRRYFYIRKVQSLKELLESVDEMEKAEIDKFRTLADELTANSQRYLVVESFKAREDVSFCRT